MVLIIKLGKTVQPVQKVTEEKAIPQSSPIPEPPPDFVLVGETVAELEAKNRIRSRHRKVVKDAPANFGETASAPVE